MVICFRTELKRSSSIGRLAAPGADCNVNDAYKFWAGMELRYWSEPEQQLSRIHPAIEPIVSA